MVRIRVRVRDSVRVRVRVRGRLRVGVRVRVGVTVRVRVRVRVTARCRNFTLVTCRHQALQRMRCPPQTPSPTEPSRDGADPWGRTGGGDDQTCSCGAVGV